MLTEEEHVQRMEECLREQFEGQDMSTFWEHWTQLPYYYKCKIFEFNTLLNAYDLLKELTKTPRSTTK
jgi:hypothetical protein